MKTIFITGINSFIGTQLALFLKSKGHQVKGSLSDLSKSIQVKGIAAELTEIKLGQELSREVIPQGVDVLIYAAHDKNNAGNNLETNKLLYEIGRSKGCQYHIFISSISADLTNKTDYGQVKLELESFFLKKEDTVVIRPGLVIGNGGLFLNMESFISKNKIIPLPDGGKYEMAVIEMDKLSKTLGVLVEEQPKGAFNLYNPQLISLREIVRTIAKGHGKNIYILNIPINFTLYFFDLFTKILMLLKIKNKFSLDSVAGYKIYKDLRLPASDLGRFIKDKT
jgi:nucleoside-diphosphate-sugar epimerase